MVWNVSWIIAYMNFYKLSHVSKPHYWLHDWLTMKLTEGWWKQRVVWFRAVELVSVCCSEALRFSTDSRKVTSGPDAANNLHHCGPMWFIFQTAYQQQEGQDLMTRTFFVCLTVCKSDVFMIMNNGIKKRVLQVRAAKKVVVHVGTDDAG